MRWRFDKMKMPYQGTVYVLYHDNSWVAMFPRATNTFPEKQKKLADAARGYALKISGEDVPIDRL